MNTDLRAIAKRVLQQIESGHPGAARVDDCKSGELAAEHLYEVLVEYKPEGGSK